MRNILFILVDCLRADAVSGKDRGTVTPAIDKLMTRGTYFNQAISTAGTTTTCVASMLTGNYPFAHGIRTLSGYKLNSDCVTLPQVLKHHGYHTYAMVSGPLSPITGLDRGFDEYEYRTDGVYLSDDWGEDLRRRFQQKQLREPWFAFLHLWEVHKPRKVLPKFDSKQFGADKYERAVSSLDPELEKLINLLGDDTIIILHGRSWREPGSRATESPRPVLPLEETILLSRRPEILQSRPWISRLRFYRSGSVAVLWPGAFPQRENNNRSGSPDRFLPHVG